MKPTSFHVVLHNPKAMPGQARECVAKSLLPKVEEMFQRGVERVRLTAEEDEDAITEEQRGYLHGVVLTECALYCKDAGGKRYPVKMWKEYFRDRLLGSKRKTFTNPRTGRKVSRTVRVSTEDLGMTRLAKYIDEVIAIIADELGHAVSEPLPPHLRPQRAKPPKCIESVDEETGEIIEEPA